MVQRIARVRVALSGWTGGPGLATFYYQPEVPGDDPTLSMAQDCADGVRAAFSNLLNMFPAFMSINVQTPVDVILDTTGVLEDSFAITPPDVVIGDAGGLALPQASMLCVNWLTGDIVNGKRVRGRSFIGPLKQVGDADGTPTSAQLTQMDEFGDDLDITPYTQVVWHRPVSGAGGKACVVTSHVTNNRFAILTSRRG